MKKRKDRMEKRTVFGGWLLVLFCLAALPASAREAERDTTEEARAFVDYDENPRFAGNVFAWMYAHLRYPEEALAKGEEGRVFVAFTVGKDGKVSDARVLRGVSPALDKAAVELISMMPAWIPGKQKGEPVRVSYTLPVVFSLKSAEPPVADTYDAYMADLKKREERLKAGEARDSLSDDLYARYLRSVYGYNDKGVYKSVYKDTKTRQQSAELMLGVTIPALRLSDTDKALILKAYKDEWAEQIRLIDSLPEESFTEEYASLVDRLRENSTRRELGLRERLGDAKYKQYVEGCILYAGRLVMKNADNPLVGRWELVERNGERPAFPLYKELREDFRFQCSNGDRGTYRSGHGYFYTETGDVSARNNVAGYEGRYEYSLHSVVLVLSGEVRWTLTDGSVNVEKVDETWRRIE